MTLREILQIEIWSKKTSRKIAITVVVLVFASVVFYGVDMFLVSPMERHAGVKALAQIDELRPLVNGGDEAYQAADERAKKQVEIANQAGFTSRDKNIASILSNYLVLTEAEKSDQTFRLKVSTSSDKRVQKLSYRDPEFLRSRLQFLDLLKQILHRELD